MMSTASVHMNSLGPGRRKGLLLPRVSMLFSEDSPRTAGQGQHKYDESTGQVYTETTARILSSKDRAWARRTWVMFERNDEEDAKYLKATKIWEARRLGKTATSEITDAQHSMSHGGGGGTRSLQSTALEQVIQNLADLTVDSFEYLPITLVKRIWDVARKRCAISFDTWALFSKILYSEDYISEDLLQYAEAFSSPHLQLEMYTKPITSISFDFITSLCITTPFPVADLTKLADIRNLGVLEIINVDASSVGYAPTGVSDRLIRNWHDAAKHSGAFPVLRVLSLWHHPELTTKSLVYLNAFPSLAVYDVRGCNIDKRARSSASDLGWKLNDQMAILKVLENTCSRRSELLRRQASQSIVPPELDCDEEEIRRLPADQVTNFLISQLSIQPQEAQQLLLNPEPSFPRRALNKPTRIMERQDKAYLQRSQKLDGWETMVYKTYARIGELREETDLKRVGVPIDDLVVKGNVLLNPIPMVMLRLGKSMLGLTMKMKSVQPQFFIRIQAPSAEWPMKHDGSKSAGTGDPISKELAVRMVQSKDQKAQCPDDQRQRNLQKHKKRRLDDILESFT